MTRGPSSRRGPGWLLALGLAGMLSGCGPTGVGSVELPANPNAKSIGAPPRSKSQPGTSPPPTRPARKKAGNFSPG